MKTIELTKEYKVILDSEENLIDFSTNKINNNIIIQDSFTFFESDNLQICIDYILNKGIETFSIPINLYGQEILLYKKKQVIANNTLTSYKDNNPVYSDNVLIGYIEETDESIILQNKIKFWKWQYPQRTIRLTGDVNLFFTGGDYAAFMNQLIMRDTIKYYQYNESNDTGTIYFDYLETLNGLFSLNLETQIISCSDPRLTIEQLYNTGYVQSDGKIYKV